MPRPVRVPIGLQLAHAQKAVSRSFADALQEAGGALPEWLILLALVTREPANQRELAAAVNIRAATLTHHLHAMEADGLIQRVREPENRRVQRVTLTPAGQARFFELRDAAASFDARLRRGISAAELGQLSDLLQRLRHNVGDEVAATPS